MSLSAAFVPSSTAHSCSLSRASASVRKDCPWWRRRVVARTKGWRRGSSVTREVIPRRASLPPERPTPSSTRVRLGAARDCGYRETHPWVRESGLPSKSVVRDMYERRRTFTEFVAHYGLARSEGLVLRYLRNAYRGVAPDGARPGQDRRARRDRRMARRDGPPDRLEPAG